MQRRIDAYRDEPWFPLAFLPNGGYLPDDVTSAKWYFEMVFDPTGALSALRQPLLAILGDKDRWVPVQEIVDAIRSAVRDTSQLTIYLSERSGHLMSGSDESADYGGELPVEPEYTDVIVRWIAGLPGN